MKYNFDTIIDRNNTDAIKQEALLTRWGRNGLSDTSIYHGSITKTVSTPYFRLYEQARFLLFGNYQLAEKTI